MGVSQKATRLLSLCLIGLLSVIPAIDAAAQDGGGVIRGGVFCDENGNGLWDGEEAPLEGVAITLTDGTREHQLVSTADGGFYLDVPYGVWQGGLHIPEGYIATNDTTRQVSLSADGVQEAVMNFGLISATPDQPESGGVQGPAPEDSLGEAPPSEADESAAPATAGQGVPEAETSGESAGPEQEGLDLLADPEGVKAMLPLSGSASPLLLIAGALSLMLALGFVLIRAARRIR